MSSGASAQTSVQVQSRILLIAQDAEIRRSVWEALAKRSRITFASEAQGGLRRALKLLRNGAQDYLMKPFAPELLEARVHTWIEIKHTREILQTALVREMATSLGGDVRLDSELGSGSTFTVTLPSPVGQENRVGLG